MVLKEVVMGCEESVSVDFVKILMMLLTDSGFKTTAFTINGLILECVKVRYK